MSRADVVTLVSAIAAIVAAAGSYFNSRRIHEVHVAINSRMDELLRVSGIAARAEGVTMGRRDSADARNREVP